MDYKEQIAKSIAEASDLTADAIKEYVEIPPNTELGDYSFPCFRLAKQLKKAPQAIAEELLGKIEKGTLFDKIEVMGGYLNFFVNKATFVENTFKTILQQGDLYGNQTIGEGKTVVIDYSAPNIAKPFHIGHLRSTVIGGALYKIYQTLGYHVVGINHLGDWGIGISKIIAGYEMWKEEYDFSERPIDAILKIYVRFNQRENEDPSFANKARNAFQRLEAGDEEVVKLWKWLVEVSLASYQKIYDLIGCQFDSYNGEAFYTDKMDRIVKMLEEKHLLVESEGARVVMMPDNMPPCIIITSAGTTIYATRDLAALVYRIENYHFDKAIYVVGAEQSLHFKQVFTTLGLMGYEKYAQNCVHIPFGLVLDENGEKMGSRKGNAVTLEDIFKEAIEKSLQIIQEKNNTLENKEEVAKMVGVGAIIFNYLANNRIKDEIFDWKQILNFAGETGPYMQYTYVRTQSILRNANCIIDENIIDYSQLTDAEALEVVKQLRAFPEVIVAAAEKYEPSLIARYLIDLAQSFSRFYNEHHIIGEEAPIQNARLALTKVVGMTIKKGLQILGIEVPDKM